MYTVLYIWDASPQRKRFKSLEKLKSFIKAFPADIDNGFWIDIWVEGKVHYIDY